MTDVDIAKTAYSAFRAVMCARNSTYARKWDELNSDEQKAVILSANHVLRTVSDWPDVLTQSWDEYAKQVDTILPKCQDKWFLFASSNPLTNSPGNLPIDVFVTVVQVLGRIPKQSLTQPIGQEEFIRIELMFNKINKMLTAIEQKLTQPERGTTSMTANPIVSRDELLHDALIDLHRVTLEEAILWVMKTRCGWNPREWVSATWLKHELPAAAQINDIERCLQSLASRGVVVRAGDYYTRAT